MIRYHLVFFILINLLCACNSDKEEQVKYTDKYKSESINKLSGQVYYFAPVFDSVKCETLAFCDCCSSHILFLNNKDFITISYCVADKDIYKGTYKMDGDKIHFYYDSLGVSKIGNIELLADSIKQEFTITSQITKPTDVTMTTFYCKDQICFKTDDNDIVYGAVDHKANFDKSIKELKDEGIWKKLNLD